MDNNSNIGGPSIPMYSQCKGKDKVMEKKKVNAVVKPKAIWSQNLSSIFIDVCIKEVRAGNRPGTHFNKIGWTNIVQEFNALTSKGWDKGHLKNRWDVLKKDWEVWDEMVGKETGLGWDHSNQTISASDAWWENKIARNPLCEKFRLQGLSDSDKLDELFSDITAIGGRAWAPNSGVLPQRFEVFVDDDDGNDDNDDDDADDNEEEDAREINVGENTTATNVQEPEKESTPRMRKRGVDKITSQEKKTKRASAASKISKQVDRICDVMESKSTATSVRHENPTATITDVMSILDAMPDIEDDMELFIFAARFFMKRDNREMFVALTKPQRQLAWLREEQSKENELVIVP